MPIDGNGVFHLFACTAVPIQSGYKGFDHQSHPEWARIFEGYMQSGIHPTVS